MPKRCVRKRTVFPKGYWMKQKRSQMSKGRSKDAVGHLLEAPTNLQDSSQPDDVPCIGSLEITSGSVCENNTIESTSNADIGIQVLKIVSTNTPPLSTDTERIRSEDAVEQHIQDSSQPDDVLDSSGISGGNGCENNIQVLKIVSSGSGREGSDKKDLHVSNQPNDIPRTGLLGNIGEIVSENNGNSKAPCTGQANGDNPVLEIQLNRKSQLSASKCMKLSGELANSSYIKTSTITSRGGVNVIKLGPLRPLTAPGDMEESSVNASSVTPGKHLSPGIYRVDQQTKPPHTPCSQLNFSVISMEFSLSPIKEGEEDCDDTVASSTPPESSQPPLAQLQEELDVNTVVNIHDIACEVTPLLPKHWLYGLQADTDINVLLMCPKGLAVQRCLKFDANGSVTIVVHSKPLDPQHELLKQLPPPVAFKYDSRQLYIQYILNVVNIVKWYVICLGIPDDRYASYAIKVPDLWLDTNHYGEARFLKTYRSKNCLQLINGSRAKRCKVCAKVKDKVAKRVKNAENEPHLKTNNRYLTSPQVLAKLRQDNRSKRALRVQAKRLRDIINELFDEEGLLLHETIHNDLKSLISKAKQRSKKEDFVGEENVIIVKGKKHKLSPEQYIFITQQLKYASLKSGTGMNWHPLMIRIGLLIQMAAPGALDAINGTNVIRFPTSRTLYDYTNFEKTDVGISWPAMKHLEEEMDQFEHKDKEYQRYHVLMVDEITISSNLVRSKSSGEIIGYANLGSIEEALLEVDQLVANLDTGYNFESEEDVDDPDTTVEKKEKKSKNTKVPPLAKKLLTFMVKGIATRRKRIVAMYGVSTLTARYMYEVTWRVIEELEMANVYVLALVCDGCGVNRTFIEMHPPHSTDSYVLYDTMNQHGNRVLYFISDVPHLLKTLRNNFFASGTGPKHTRRLIRNGQDIVWKSIVDLYEAEKNNIVRLASKLNKQCVELTQKGKMKVCYACWVFSKTVANALEQMKDLSLCETIDFIRRVNDFFDCLNGKYSGEGKRKQNDNLAPYTSVNDPRFGELKEFLTYLDEWKAEIRMKAKILNISLEDQRKFLLSDETQKGVEMTVRSVIAATKFMLEAGAKFINARVFCQDPLEQYFSKQRASVCGSTNPNLKQFLSTANRINDVDEHVHFKKKGNTTEYLDEIRADLNAPLKRIKREQRKRPAKRSLSFVSGIETVNHPTIEDLPPTKKILSAIGNDAGPSVIQPL